ncbi:hypothetical protein BU23DRAFT_590653 [Bimuria novae-zelandiae CBS 107.79]|uniref:Dipeptidase n=1 Tax=Bimuria novae-zelandiae CBS 107.79 TaxID=1447943 RepID=A0A6A5VDY0_9PLEO|nr:hypothetical protein BU23DRAFT_590653 [Bimuria novae-zelandiae CBS 107.79]
MASPSRKTMFCSATILGFLNTNTARVMWKSDSPRMMRDYGKAVRYRPRRGADCSFIITLLVTVLLQTVYFFLHPLSNLFQNKSFRHALESLTFEQRAYKILKENPLIDGHNDLLISLRGLYQNHIYGHDFKEKFENGGFPQHVDLPRLEVGMQGGAFWSAFMPCPVVKMALEALDTYNRLGQLYPKYFTLSPDSHAAEKAFKDGTLISPVIIEGLHQIGNSLSMLRLYHKLGVRYATLTWNCHNAYADAALESNDDFSARIATPYWHGLSLAGRSLVLEMNRLGMLVDLAHVSVATMRDVLIGNGTAAWKGSIVPPIFSHSSAHAIYPHPRNVPDDILHLVKKRNSIVMVNFSPGFISCKPGETPGDLPIFDPENSTLKHVVKHIRHIGELIGYDHHASGLEDISKFPDLVAELLRQGISDEDVGKIVGRNILRVWREADEVAAKLQKTMVPLEDQIRNPWQEKSGL